MSVDYAHTPERTICVSVAQVSHLQNKELAATQATQTRVKCINVCVYVCETQKKRKEVDCVCVVLLLSRLLMTRDGYHTTDDAMEAPQGHNTSS